MAFRRRKSSTSAWHELKGARDVMLLLTSDIISQLTSLEAIDTSTSRMP